MRISVLGLVPALALGVAIGGFTQIRADEPSILHAVAADTQFTLSGHGNGHGRGMGQWGAYATPRTTAGPASESSVTTTAEPSWTRCRPPR